MQTLIGKVVLFGDFGDVGNLDGVSGLADDDAGLNNPDRAIVRAASLLGLFGHLEEWRSITHHAVHRLEAQEEVRIVPTWNTYAPWDSNSCKLSLDRRFGLHCQARSKWRHG